METKLFTTNKSQAVRLSKAVAFPDDVKSVTIVTVGRSRLITPSNAVWDDFFDGAGRGMASDDYMTSRDQPEAQSRENF